MKEIYRHHDYARVGLLEDILRGEGIEVLLRNRNLTTLGLAEIPIPEFYPNICLLDERQEERALGIVEEFLAAERRPMGKDWVCGSCGEPVPDSLMECWACQAKKV